MSFKFEDLRVWQQSIEFSGKIAEMTESFPTKELWVLTSQIKRAADSIALNIAEGSTGQTNPEFKRFLGFAIRSGIEVVCCLYLAKKRKLINQQTFEKHYKSAQELIIMIQALRKSIR